jgi:two-component system, OmpR family, response regulator ChvI
LAEEIQFTDNAHNCCVCFVDIVDSTKITTIEISDPEKIKKFYSIFINTMAVIARNFGANVIKTTGDSLIYYFPQTVDSPNNVSAFKNVFECGLTMLSVNPIVNSKLQSDDDSGFPNLSYRISADYGRVEIATSLTSATEDLFGPTVNLCAKINSKAEPNGMVIGNNLYQITKTTFEYYYHFNKTDGYSIDDNSDNQYPVYSIISKDKKSNYKKLKKLYNNIL